MWGATISGLETKKGRGFKVNDSFNKSLENSKNNLNKILNRLVEKEKINNETKKQILGRIKFSSNLKDIEASSLVIEAIVEDISIKQKLFKEIEPIVTENCIIATNTSSLSIASIAGVCKKADRVIGMHFFNPAPLMPLVEIIPAVQTSQQTSKKTKNLIDSWEKVSVIVKDTPGFIVNRVARPFYGEALRIYEEGIADFITIDWAIKEIGGFRMGPFELMDYIGNDVNYTVTETVFNAFYFDPRYKPSFTQKRMKEAGYYGRKTGKGFYDYSQDLPEPKKDYELGKKILFRILSMLINEAADAVFLNIASKKDIDLAMTKGVNYPKGLLSWADEIGIKKVFNQLDELYNEYSEDRYRPSPILKRMIKNNQTFF